jgi:predicted acylesterase/phospholipase RssA
MATLGATPISTHYFQLRVGGDIAAVKGIMKHVLAQEDARGGVLDHAFIAEHTTGFEALADDLRAEDWSLLEAESGLSRAQMQTAAEVYIAARSTIICWGMGNIMQMRITRSRMAGDPPELVIAPRLSHLGLLDFHRAREAIDEGYEAAQAALPGLRHWGL